MSTDSPDTERTVVKTYVPTYQKEQWVNHASELDMSLSEFIRSMVQAGRKHFSEDPLKSPSPDSNPTDASSPDSNPRGSTLESAILDILEEGPCSWEELVEEIIGDLETDLRSTLVQLQRDGPVVSDPLDGYILQDEQ